VKRLPASLLLSFLLASPAGAEEAKRNCPAQIFIQSFQVRIDMTKEEEQADKDRRAQDRQAQKDRLKAGMKARFRDFNKDFKKNKNAPVPDDLPEKAKEAAKDGFTEKEMEDLAESFAEQEMKKEEAKDLSTHGDRDATYEEVLGFNLEDRIRQALQARLSRVQIQTQVQLTSTLTATQKRQEELAKQLEEGKITKAEHDRLIGEMPELDAELAQLQKSDFIISGKLIQLGNILSFTSQFVKNDGNVFSPPRLARFNKACAHAGEVEEAVEQMAAIYTNAVVDKFFCIDLMPNPVILTEKETKVKARVLDLRNKPIAGREVRFLTSNFRNGTFDKTSIETDSGGIAENTYKVEKWAKNELKARVQAEKVGGAEGIWTETSVDATPPRWILKIDGEDNVHFSFHEGDVNHEADTPSTFNGSVTLDVEESEIKGTGVLKSILSNTGSGNVDNFAAWHSGHLESEMEAKVSGTINDSNMVMLTVTWSGAKPMVSTIENSEGGSTQVTSEDAGGDTVEVALPLEDGATKTVAYQRPIGVPGFTQEGQITYTLEMEKPQ